MAGDTSRRDFVRCGVLVTAGLLATRDPLKAQAQESEDRSHADHPHGAAPHPTEPVDVGSPEDRGRLVPGQTKGFVPVEAPDLTKLEWEMKNGAKEFHLVCEHIQREFLPGMAMDVWGYNGSMPGPMIEVFEGDRVRIIVHNNLPEPTSVHWHGLEVPNVMDGVPGVSQDPIPPGETFTYEFDLRQNGTFFYHSHGAMQEGMGLVGLFIIHPKVPYDPPVDRDFALILQEWAILPGSTVPNTMSMEFNFFTINGQSAPYVTPLVIREGERVRIRLVNFSVIDHHPMHLHGLTFWVTGTEAGRMPQSAWYPSNNVLVAVAQAREIEFIANNPGDWVMHCHMFHHMMNHMVSMVGMMGGHTQKGMPAGGNMANSMGMITQGPALSETFGATLGRGTGEQTGNERAVTNGPRAASAPTADEHSGHKIKKTPVKDETQDMKDMPGMDHGEREGMNVPGFPQDMSGMEMYTTEQIEKITANSLTRGMRSGWYNHVEGLMTVVRVLPSDLYERVVSSKGKVTPGESVPGLLEKHKHPPVIRGGSPAPKTDHKNMPGMKHKH